MKEPPESAFRLCVRRTRLGGFVNKRAMPRLTATFVMLVVTFVIAQPIHAGQGTLPSTGMTVVSKRTNNLVITIITVDGRLKGGENSFCVVFQKKGTEEPVDFNNVSVDFTWLVGRIQENPITTQLTADRDGRYCGQVNLVKQNYIPASYYAFVRYTDESGKKRKQRFFLNVK